MYCCSSSAIIMKDIYGLFNYVLLAVALFDVVFFVCVNHTEW